MALKWTNKDELDRQFREFEYRYNQKAVEWMARLGEMVVKYAREHGNYTDRTANLRNSIGYLVVHSGNVVKSSFEGKLSPKIGTGANSEMAHSKGLNHARAVARELDNTKTYLVWVAGMEYAAYVEAKGFDVIRSSGDWLEANAKKQVEMFKRYLLSKK